MQYAEAIQNYIQTGIMKNRPGITLELDTPLLTSGIIDSLGIVSLVSFIEESFSIKVPLEDITIENFQSIELIEQYLCSQASPGVAHA